MNKLKLNDKEYFLPKHTETSSQLDLVVSGCLVSEIKALTDLSEVQITSEDGGMIGEWSDMELGNSISYSTTLDQTSFSLLKSGAKDLSSQITDLQSQIKELQDVIAEQQVMLTALASNTSSE